MSGRKNQLAAYTIISAGNMASASITSSVTNIANLDNIGVQATWAGTAPVGTLDIQVSADNSTFVSIPAVSLAVSGNAGSAYIDMNQLSAPYIRALYTKTSGVGSLTVKIVAKMI